MFSGASVLLFAQRKWRNSSCCGFPSGKGPGYGGTWHCPPLRDAESHQESLRTLQSQNHPGSIERAVLSRAELIRDPCHSDLKCSEQPQWFGEKQKHQLAEGA